MRRIPLSLYIHFPWCVRKCPYCDFNSHTLKTDLPEKDYIDLLLKDLCNDLPLVENRKIHSIFMGGGTPSLFSPASIKYLLDAIRNSIDFEHDAIEITLEANPGTVEQEKFTGFREAGVNRLSIGIQSFQIEKLKRLGRIHDDNAAKRAALGVKNAGFHNFNLDLMHGLPDQLLADALYDLQTAIGFSPPHLSWYQLTLEPNTLFHHQPPKLPAEESLLKIQESGHQLLLHNHYQHYEVSAYSQEGHQCQHNLNYWEYGDYLGIGAGAHAKITNIEAAEIMRYTKIKHPRDYLTSEAFTSSAIKVEQNQIPFEFMLNALRLQKPISWDLFEARTGLTQYAIVRPFEKLQARNLINITANNFCLTNMGRRFLNDVLTEFM